MAFIGSAKLVPDDLVTAIRARSEAQFVREWSDTALLLIRIDDPGSELAHWLTATGTSQGVPLTPSRDGIMFTTAMSTHPRMLAAVAATHVRRPTVASIVANVERASYFVAPLRKRGAEGKPFAERISVGRARNNDIVLRHPTVSKFHAWFDCDYDDVLILNDAKSTNRTSAGGDVLPPGGVREVQSGTEVKFGEVSCVVCSPKMVWEIVHAWTAT